MFKTLCAMILAVVVAGCSTVPRPAAEIPAPLTNALLEVQHQFAPDNHMAIFRVVAVPQGGHFVLQGDVENAAAKEAALAAAAKAGFKVTDRISVLPDKNLGDKLWGIVTLSVVNIREKPVNPAEVGSQALTGQVFRVWKKATNWYLVQTADRYVGWVENGGFTNCTRADVDRWNAAPRLIITNYEERILEQPAADAMPISDVVMGSVVERVDESGDWYKVALADGRTGFLPKTSAMDYAAWQASRQPTPENIEHTARLFLGRPYSWGGNSSRGLDCSGLTKFVFFLNGIALDRNASEQCKQGVEVPLDDNLKNLKKGDLLFFGHRARHGKPELVDHTGIYLGDKLFIQASELVRISSLDRNSPLRDPRRIRSLLHARRILPSP